jgi:hypothetical protein
MISNSFTGLGFMQPNETDTIWFNTALVDFFQKNTLAVSELKAELQKFKPFSVDFSHNTKQFKSYKFCG